jgi:hypothetical protein
MHRDSKTNVAALTNTKHIHTQTGYNNPEVAVWKIELILFSFAYTQCEIIYPYITCVCIYVETLNAHRNYTSNSKAEVVAAAVAAEATTRWF